MRKNIFGTILFAAALTIAAISCRKSLDESGPTAGNDGTIEIKVNAAMGQYSPTEATKAGRVAVTRVSWKGGETVYVYDGTQCLGSLRVTLDGTEDRYALLSTNAKHTVAKPADGTTKLTLLYSPLFKESPAVAGGAISISLARQMDAVPPFVIYATLDYNGAETISITDAVVPFKLATSLITVNCAGLEPGKAVKYAKLGNVNTVCKLTLSGKDEPTITGEINGIILKAGDANFEAENMNSGGNAIIQIATPVLEATESETYSDPRVLTVTQGAFDFTDEKFFSRKSLPAATAVNSIINFAFGYMSVHRIGVFSVSTTKKVYFSPGNLQATYISSTKKYRYDFAPNQYDFIGNAPGNTTIDTQTDGAVVDLFGWSTSHTDHGISTSQDRGDRHIITYDDYGGSFDDWGDVTGDRAWYTLDIDQWEYLLQNHSIRLSCVNGVMGYVIAPDDFTGTLAAVYSDDVALLIDDILFIPAAGRRSGSDVRRINIEGDYWSSSASGHNQAYCMTLSALGEEPVEPKSTFRYFGRSVRLVRN